MSSDNPSGADNQQERHAEDTWMNAIPSDVGHYIAGFVDGEEASMSRYVDHPTAACPGG